MKRFIYILLMCMATCAYSQELYIYGGDDHKTKLGCLTCSKYDSESIWNIYGDYGSKYSSNSIWNKYGDFGSKYSSSSPWNAYSSTPPVVVDMDGNFYGYLTTDKYKSNRADFKLALILYEFYEEIQEDVSKWYDRIFR